MERDTCAQVNNTCEEATWKWEPEQVHEAKLTLQYAQNNDQAQDKIRKNWRKKKSRRLNGPD